MDDIDASGNGSGEELGSEYGDGELGGPKLDRSRSRLGRSINQSSGAAGQAIRSDRWQQRFDNSTGREPYAFEHTGVAHTPRVP